MKIISIEKYEDTDNFLLTKCKFINWYGKTTIRICITEKLKNHYTSMFDNGETVPIKLWNSFRAFLESKKDKIEIETW